MGRNTDVIMTTLYVAISRFRRANDLLILQPLNIEVLQQGEPALAAFLLEHLELMAAQNQDEARQRADAYGEQVRAQRASKRTADRRLAENLSEETRDAQRRRLEENKEAGMSTEVRERQQSANEARREMARCDKCGADKTSGEYKYNQWRNRQKKLPTCEACQIKMKQQQIGERRGTRSRPSRYSSQ